MGEGPGGEAAGSEERVAGVHHRQIEHELRVQRVRHRVERLHRGGQARRQLAPDVALQAQEERVTLPP
eukprot:7805497-Pyramimonas_sp.AAC.1